MSARVCPWLPATLVRDVRVNEHARVLFLHAPGWPGNAAGHHLDLRVTAADGYRAERSYSLASSGPAGSDNEILEIAVDILPDGEVSPYLGGEFSPGDQLEVRGPIGEFFVWREQQTEPVQLIAGGSGVVPLVGIARAHDRAGHATPLRMLYSVRSSADAFYTEELTDLATRTLEMHWVYTRETPAGIARATGRLTSADIAASVIAPTDDPLVYVCGPTGFVETTTDLLVAAGHDPQRIKTERFGGF